MPFAGYEDFEACVADHSDKEDPEAYCAQIHKDATGEYPGQDHDEKAASETVDLLEELAGGHDPDLTGSAPALKVWVETPQHVPDGRVAHRGAGGPSRFYYALPLPIPDEPAADMEPEAFVEVEVADKADAREVYDCAGVAEKATWVPYEGPRGGEGWRDLETGRVHYGDKPSGTIESEEELRDALAGAVGDDSAGGGSTAARESSGGGRTSGQSGPGRAWSAGDGTSAPDTEDTVAEAFAGAPDNDLTAEDSRLAEERMKSAWGHTHFPEMGTKVTEHVGEWVHDSAEEDSDRAYHRGVASHGYRDSKARIALSRGGSGRTVDHESGHAFADAYGYDTGASVNGYAHDHPENGVPDWDFGGRHPDKKDFMLSPYGAMEDRIRRPDWETYAERGEAIDSFEQLEVGDRVASAASEDVDGAAEVSVSGFTDDGRLLVHSPVSGSGRVIGPEQLDVGRVTFEDPGGNVFSGDVVDRSDGYYTVSPEGMVDEVDVPEEDIVSASPGLVRMRGAEDRDWRPVEDFEGLTGQALSWQYQGKEPVRGVCIDETKAQATMRLEDGSTKQVNKSQSFQTTLEVAEDRQEFRPRRDSTPPGYDEARYEHMELSERDVNWTSTRYDDPKKVADEVRRGDLVLMNRPDGERVVARVSDKWAWEKPSGTGYVKDGYEMQVDYGLDKNGDPIEAMDQEIGHDQPRVGLSGDADRDSWDIVGFAPQEQYVDDAEYEPGDWERIKPRDALDVEAGETVRVEDPEQGVVRAEVERVESFGEEGSRVIARSEDGGTTGWFVEDGEIITNDQWGSPLARLPEGGREPGRRSARTGEAVPEEGPDRRFDMDAYDDMEKGDVVTVEDPDTGEEVHGTIDRKFFQSAYVRPFEGAGRYRVTFDDDGSVDMDSPFAARPVGYYEEGLPEDPDAALPEDDTAAAEDIFKEVNKAWYRAATDNPGGHESSRYHVKSSYSETNAHEMMAMTHETMQGSSMSGVRTLFDEHPDLTAAYCRAFEPPERVKRQLNDLHSDHEWSSPFDDVPYPEEWDVPVAPDVDVGDEFTVPEGFVGEGDTAVAVERSSDGYRYAVGGSGERFWISDDRLRTAVGSTQDPREEYSEGQTVRSPDGDMVVVTDVSAQGVGGRTTDGENVWISARDLEANE